jgi:hypothetical protein
VLAGCADLIWAIHKPIPAISTCVSTIPGGRELETQQPSFDPDFDGEEVCGNHSGDLMDQVGQSALGEAAARVKNILEKLSAADSH